MQGIQHCAVAAQNDQDIGFVPRAVAVALFKPAEGTYLSTFGCDKRQFSSAQCGLPSSRAVSILAARESKSPGVDVNMGASMRSIRSSVIGVTYLFAFL